MDGWLMVDIYRKHAGHLHDWHFQPRCPDWPEADYIEQVYRPRVWWNGGEEDKILETDSIFSGSTF
jgi:hypothetical protein